MAQPTQPTQPGVDTEYVHSVLFGNSPIQWLEQPAPQQSAEMVRYQTLPTAGSSRQYTMHASTPASIDPATDTPFAFRIPLGPVYKSHTSDTDLGQSSQSNRFIVLSSIDLTQIIGVLNNACTVAAFVYNTDADIGASDKRAAARVCKTAAAGHDRNPEPMAASVILSPGSQQERVSLMNSHVCSDAKKDEASSKIEDMCFLMAVSDRRGAWRVSLTEHQGRKYSSDVIVNVWHRSNRLDMSPIAWFISHEFHEINKELCYCRNPATTTEVAPSAAKIKYRLGARGDTFSTYFAVAPDTYNRITESLLTMTDRSSLVITPSSVLVIEFHPTQTRVTGHQSLVDMSIAAKTNFITICANITSKCVSIDTTSTPASAAVFVG